MKTVPQRVSLVAQTTAILRDAIFAGQWPRWLPGELELSRRLTVSRATLRAALLELEREGTISAGQGRRREVLCASPVIGKRTVSKTVALLSPGPLYRLPVSTVYWVDELRESVERAGALLEIQERPGAYSRRPDHALDELAARVHPAGWVLLRSTLEMQRWFSEHARNAVVAGSLHSGSALTSVDIDYAAGCQHAAARFEAAGHRHIAIVRPASKLAGDIESVAAFREHTNAEVAEVVHDGTVRGICVSLDRLFVKRPSALFVFQSEHLLTVYGWLQLRGLRIPGDVSVVCRDDEPYLESVLPAPTRYRLNAGQYGRLISRLVISHVTGAPAGPRSHRIMPTFVKGASLGRV